MARMVPLGPVLAVEMVLRRLTGMRELPILFTAKEDARERYEIRLVPGHPD